MGFVALVALRTPVKYAVALMVLSALLLMVAAEMTLMLFAGGYLSFCITRCVGRKVQKALVAWR